MKKRKNKILSCGKVKRCARVNDLSKENTELKEEVKELKAQIGDLRRSLYGKKKKKKEKPDLTAKPKKKGAPFGHKGVTRRKPKHIDEEIPVRPDGCPCRGSKELIVTSIKPEEHIQEDIVSPKKKVTKYVKLVFKCSQCHRLVRGGLGPDEISNAYIGPKAKALANSLRYGIGIPQHKIKRIFEELFDLPFDQTSAAGFENQLRRRGQKVHEEMKTELPAMRLLYVDETGWKENGLSRWLWCFTNKTLAFYHVDQSRGGKVVTSVLGIKFNGILLSDFLSAYNAIKSKKQKCLPHVLRMIERYYREDDEVKKFCDTLKELMKQVIYLFKQRKDIKDYYISRADLIVKIKSLLSKELNHKRTDKWRKRLIPHQKELYKCLFHPKSDFNNNFCERMLRSSVIMRKITFGSRSERGAKNHSVIMSLLQTAKLHNHNPSDIFYQIFTKPKDIGLTNLIRPP